MKMTPHYVKITAKNMRAYVREGSLSADSLEKAEPYFQKAEQEFAKSYTQTSLSWPTMASQAYDAFFSTIVKAIRPEHRLPAPATEAWNCSVFARVLTRAEQQWENRPKISAAVSDEPVFPEVRWEIVKERRIGDPRRAKGWGPVQIGELARVEGAEPQCLEVALATYPDSDLNVLSVGCVASLCTDNNAFISESRSMVSPLTYGIDSMIHAAITSLTVPRSLMEVRAAIKRAFSPSWYRSVRTGEGALFSGARYTSNAAICLLSIVCFQEHLFVANVGKNQAFLWRNGILRPLSVVHDISDSAEARRVLQPDPRWKKDAETLGDAQASRALFKHSNGGTHTRPQVSCLPLSETSGGHIVVLSPGVIDTIGAYMLRQTLAKADVSNIAGDIAACARRRGLKTDICVASIPLTYSERRA